jgi:hypothetical protein
LDRNGIVTSRTLKSSNEHDASSDLLRRCRHAAASVGSQIYIYGGLRGGNLQWILYSLLQLPDFILITVSLL